MVRTTNLVFRYNVKEAVLSFPDINLKSSENLLILGKSGIGKTTLLHLLAGILTPLNGSVEIDGVSLHTLSNRKMDRFRGQHIGLVFQKNHANRSLSVIENLQSRLFFSNRPINDKAIMELLEELDLADYKNKKPAALSEGQLQRLGIAMSVVHRPQVILADEPTSSLDDDNCRSVMQLLVGHAKAQNANLIVITHDQRVKPLFRNTLVL